jgi:hypothetical protein
MLAAMDPYDVVFPLRKRIPVPGALRAPGAFGFYPVIFDHGESKITG